MQSLTKFSFSKTFSRWTLIWGVLLWGIFLRENLLGVEFPREVLPRRGFLWVDFFSKWWGFLWGESLHGGIISITFKNTRIYLSLLQYISATLDVKHFFLFGRNAIRHFALLLNISYFHQLEVVLPNKISNIAGNYRYVCPKQILLIFIENLSSIYEKTISLKILRQVHKTFHGKSKTFLERRASEIYEEKFNQQKKVSNEYFYHQQLIRKDGFSKQKVLKSK